VFEFVDHTVLDDLEKFPTGMEAQAVRKCIWQVLKGIEFCHLHHVSCLMYCDNSGLQIIVMFYRWYTEMWNLKTFWFLKKELWNYVTLDLQEL